jgi:hypothetical protein
MPYSWNHRRDPVGIQGPIVPAGAGYPLAVSLHQWIAVRHQALVVVVVVVGVVGILLLVEFGRETGMSLPQASTT